MDDVSSCISTLCECLELAGHTSLIISVDFQNLKIYHSGTGVGRNYLIKNKDALENFVTFCSENMLPESVEQDCKEMQGVTLNNERLNGTAFTVEELGVEDVFTYTESDPVEDECLNTMSDNEISTGDLSPLQTESEMEIELDDRRFENMKDLASTEKSGVGVRSASPRRSNRKRKGDYHVIISMLKGNKAVKKFQHSLSGLESEEKGKYRDECSGNGNVEKANNTGVYSRKDVDLRHNLERYQNEKEVLHKGGSFVDSDEKGSLEVVPEIRSEVSECEPQREEISSLSHLNSELFQCELCSKIFHTEQELSSHTASHQVSIDNSCYPCVKMFKSTEDLEFYKENYCDDISEEQLTYWYMCPDCAQMFPCQEEYEKHFELHTSNQEKETCTILSDDDRQEELYTYNGLMEETDSNSENTLTKDKSNNMSEIRTVSDTISKSASKFNKYDLECEVCGQTFKEAFNLYQHKMKNHGYDMFPCRFCNYVGQTQRNLTKHLKKHQQLFLVCKVCGEGFTEKREFIAHAWSQCHKTSKNMYCEKQAKSFPNNQAHEQLHLKDDSCKCNLCTKSYNTSSNGKHHEEKKHQDQQPFVSNSCGKDFTEKSNTTASSGSHSTKNLLFCEKCGKTFQDKQAFISHKKVHLGKGSFKCKFCEKCFYSSSYRKCHEKIHLNKRSYLCHFCGKSFNQSTTMNCHIRLHHKNHSAHICPTCGKSFKIKKYLKTHIIHKHLKPEDIGSFDFRVFICKVCQKLYPDNFHLKQHMKIHEKRMKKHGSL